VCALHARGWTHMLIQPWMTLYHHRRKPTHDECILTCVGALTKGFLVLLITGTAVGVTALNLRHTYQ
jgi:hypothetical protein